MKQWFGFGVMGLALGGCIPESRVPAGPVPIESDSIRYETGPCFGRCPVYAVTVRPDGTGGIRGQALHRGDRRTQLYAEPRAI